ncbi:hypothetical protein O181_112003 [Austropuccinia psidii MF-1]|uniref:GAG-pre-integrase domain-containing protein n=1 Tax=Austropuccinia psidii MF-1 TaxID=1389203 RepID=A0A9Q3JZM4_9BASI|nr:hypothetical protein [Austropuccinia psidii MF-1]
MTLSVASSKSFYVNAVGKIKLNTPDGTLELDGVLCCKNISGVILSLGHLMREHFSILFINHHSTLSTSYTIFNTYKGNNQWFIPFCLPYINPISIKPLNSTTFSHDINLPSPSDISALRHKWIGHLSIRKLSLMRKSTAARGIPDISFHDIRLCHDCSISKSQHCPVKTPSFQLVTQPGDLIIADLMGPHELSLNHKKYILMIQDSFSHVTVAIPLADKTEVKSYFMN